MQFAREVGLKRITKYIMFTLWHGVFDLLLFSPLRIFWMRLGGASVGKNTIVDKIKFINLDRAGLKGLKIGDNCFVGKDTLIDLAAGIDLKNWVIISPRVTIISHMSVGSKKHPLYKRYPAKASSITIKQAAFVGVSSTILQGVVIGSKSIVGAGALVTNSISDNSLAAGIPAKVVKKIK